MYIYVCVNLLNILPMFINTIEMAHKTHLCNFCCHSNKFTGVSKFPLCLYRHPDIHRHMFVYMHLTCADSGCRGNNK